MYTTTEKVARHNQQRAVGSCSVVVVVVCTESPKQYMLMVGESEKDEQNVASR